MKINNILLRFLLYYLILIGICVVWLAIDIGEFGIAQPSRADTVVTFILSLYIYRDTIRFVDRNKTERAN